MLRICDKAIEIIDPNLQSNGRGVAFALALSIASVIVDFTERDETFHDLGKRKRRPISGALQISGIRQRRQRDAALGAPASPRLHAGVNGLRDPISAHVDEIIQRHFGTQDFELNPAAELS